MKQQANLIRAGQVIEHDGRRWTVLKQQIITPGKGGAFIQVEMRESQAPATRPTNAGAPPTPSSGCMNVREGFHLQLHRRRTTSS